MLRRILVGAAALTALLAISAATALAAPHAAGTETITEHFREEVMSEPGVNPCTGEPGTLTLAVKNGVFHATTQADGDFWVTGTFNGTVTFVPEDPEGIVYSGHFAQWFGGAMNNKNELAHDTANFHLTGTDGSRVGVHSTEHVSTNGRGEPTVTFEKTHLTCG